MPLTTGSSWEEFPPAGYEWQFQAIATVRRTPGCTCSSPAPSPAAPSPVHRLLYHHVSVGPARVLCPPTGRIPEDDLQDINGGLSAVRRLPSPSPPAPPTPSWSTCAATAWVLVSDPPPLDRAGGSDCGEQNVEITAAVLPAFDACPSPWCTFRYAYWPTWPPSTDACGCTRFRAALQRAIPAEAIEAGWGSCGVCGDPAGPPGIGQPLRPGCWGPSTPRSSSLSPPPGWRAHAGMSRCCRTARRRPVHPSAFQFATTSLDPAEITGKVVIEAGAYDVNGWPARRS